MAVKPCPPLSPTGPTLRWGLQQWPGGSLLSLGLAGSHKRWKVTFDIRFKTFGRLFKMHSKTEALLQKTECFLKNFSSKHFISQPLEQRVRVRSLKLKPLQKLCSLCSNVCWTCTIHFFLIKHFQALKRETCKHCSRSCWLNNFTKCKTEIGLSEVCIKERGKNNSKNETWWKQRRGQKLLRLH